MAVPDWLLRDPRARHFHHRDAIVGIRAPFPAWVSAQVREAVARLGVDELWEHQAEAAEAAHAGRHVAIATGTASGKSLAYLLPILAATLEGQVVTPMPSMPRLDLPQGHTALYLAPTKALAHDQLQACHDLDLPAWRVSTLDGDSDQAERRFARDFAAYALTNPDMLHRSILPNHSRWARLLGSLRYVVVDEAHRYRGTFGANTAAVLRRLRRIAHHHGAEPVFLTASATVTDAGLVHRALTGVDDVDVVDDDTSARPALDYVLWQPDSDPHREAASLLAKLVAEGRQTLTFTTSRVQAELVALEAEQLARRPGLDGDAPRIETEVAVSSSAPRRIAAYRGGYLADDRRELESRLRDGRLRGVACTNALELGVDLSGVDAVVTCGFPGTLAALWQQVGRAGRSGRDALGILVARADPLDAYLCDHPELIFERPVERTVLFPENPYVLGPHLAAAAQELPLTERDQAYFGASMGGLVQQLVAGGVLRRRPTGWYWTRPDRAVDVIDLRSISGRPIDVVDRETGRVVGQVDPAAADRTLHPGAVYLHQGDQWLVASYEPESGTALAQRQPVRYFTQPLAESEVRILGISDQRRLGAATVFAGAVELSSRVTGYLRRDDLTGKVWDSTPLDLPLRRLRTRSVWWTLGQDILEACGVAEKDLPGAAHAAEHAAIGLLPAFAPCDRWDIGGLSTVFHPDTGALTVFVHDGHPGGAGFADRGFACIEPWLAATLERLRTCPCEAGCPRCDVSPKCGNGNRPLDKAAATALLTLVIG